ncbi:MAG: hypothetical protein AB1779_12085 [Candidatus Thermoplasmatota archaeon]
MYNLKIFFIFFILIIAFIPSSPSNSYSYSPLLLTDQIAEVYAPVFYQDTGDRFDYITNFDFDNDFVGNNNWENAEKYSLKAYIYYAVTETETHWFIFYAVFHPRDYTSFEFEFLSHENDLEGLVVVVEKDGTKYGKFLLMETYAHFNFYQYTNSKNVSNAHEKIDGNVIFYDNTHPLVYIEVAGHGIYGYDGLGFPGDTGTIYYYKGIAEEPKSPNDRNVGYALKEIHSELWERRYDYGNGKMYDIPIDFHSDIYGSVFDGDTYGNDKASPPWSLDDIDDNVKKGDWFFDPAYTISSHLTINGNFSRTYIRNPFVQITLSYNLNLGWNLISIPMNIRTKNILDALESINGSYDKIEYFDPSTGKWKIYTVSKPAYMNDNIEIKNSIGFWIHTKEKATIKIKYYHPDNTNIYLRKGWNLVGYPSNTSIKAEELKNNSKIKRIVDSELLNVTSLSIWNGYWVLTDEDTSIWLEW